MLNGVFQELDRYGSMIEFLASGSKDLKEVVAYLKDMGVPESTVRGQINNIKEGNTVLIVWEEPSTLMLNRIALESAEDVICKLLKGKKTSEVEDLKAIIAQRDATIKTMVEKEKALSKELEEAIKKTLEQPVVIVSTEEILPPASAWEKQFVTMHKQETAIESNAENQQEAIPEQTQKEESVILNYVNYVKRGIQKIFTKSFMSNRVNKLLEKKGQSEFVSDKKYVNNLLATPGLTNQQKLALYAAFSDYRHTDFERLLNFAGDNNIDADLLIQWVECLGDEQDFKQIKNALRQFAKPSEYRLKCDLGKELLLGIWQVMFYKNGVPTRFRLIAETDIEMIREKLGLSESAFTYYDFVTYEEMKENKDELLFKTRGVSQ